MFASDEEGNIMDAHIDWGARGIVLCATDTPQN